jgi:AraC-like DNA-binding protein
MIFAGILLKMFANIMYSHNSSHLPLYCFMESQIYRPRHPTFQNITGFIWQVDGWPTYSKEVIVPKGIIEVIFNLSSFPVIEAHINGKEIHLPRCFISGFSTSTITIDIPPHHFYFGFRPEVSRVQDLFAVTPGELTNQIVDLTLLDPQINSLWHQLREAGDFDERVMYLKKWLLKRAVPRIVDNASLCEFVNGEQAITHTPTSLSKVLNYSSRHVSRKFVGLTGMNTEEFLLYKKFVKSVRLIHESESSLTEIAYACNFFDQSHFIRTFRNFSGYTPGDYSAQKSSLPGHIYKA